MSIENALTQYLGRRPHNMHKYVEVYDAYRLNPKIKAAQAMLDCELSKPAFFRIKRELTAAGVLGKDLFEKSRKYTIPRIMEDGLLPPKEYSTTHLLFYLTKFKEDEYVEKYDMTRKEVLAVLRDQLKNNVELGADTLYGFQERAALITVFVGDNISAYENMSGVCTPPETLEITIK